MAQRPRNVSPEIDHRWMEFRRKHEEETDRFQRDVVKNRAEFDARVEISRQRLLAKHLEAEREFWSKNGPGSRISVTPAPAARVGQMQTPRSTQATATPARVTPAPAKKPAATMTSRLSKTPAPVKNSTSAKTPAPTQKPVLWNPGPALAFPRMEIAPIRKTPSETQAQELTRPQKPSLRFIREGDKKVFLLSSSDEADPAPAKKKPIASKKTSAAPKPVEKDTAQLPQTTQMSMEEEPMPPGYMAGNFTATLPEANLEFFGDVPRAQIPPLVHSYVKEEPTQHSTPRVSSRALLPSTPPQQVFHGLPEVTSSSPFLTQASTPHFGPAGGFAPNTPPATPGFGSWNGGFDAPLSSFSPQATRMRQDFQRQPAFGSNSSFATQTQFGSPSPGFSSPNPSFSERATSTAPPSFMLGSQMRSPRHYSTPTSSQAALAKNSPKAWATLANESRSQDRPVAQAEHSPFTKTSEVSRQTRPHSPARNNLSPKDLFSTESALNVSSGADHTKHVEVEEEDISISAGDVHMLDTVEVPLEATASSPGASSTPIRQQGCLQACSASAIEHPQTVTRQLPSPPPSHASVVSDQIKSTPHRVATPSSAFKLPTNPASATPHSYESRSTAPEARNTRAGTVDSRASSFTLPAQSRGARGTSVFSRTSYDSAHTGAFKSRKRGLEHNLSDDDDDVSDYAPSEPESPLATEPAEEGRDVPVIKKSKIANGASQATLVEKKKAKNSYGFKPVTTPKPKPAASSPSLSSSAKKPSTTPSTTPSKPAATGLTLVSRASTLAPKSKTQPKAKSGPAPKYNTKNTNFVPQPSRRKAAMNAEKRLQNYFDDTEEFETACAIEDADQLEDARLPETLRQMSLTPAPSDEPVSTLIERSPSSATSNYTYSSWLRDRAHGDRNMAKKSGGRYRPMVEDEGDEEEADISEYMSVDGVIICRKAVQELDLIGAEQTTRSGRRGGEGGFWERAEGVVGCRMS